MQASYRRGDLAQATEQALAQAERWKADATSPWYWNYRLLAAETLTARSQFQQAEQLLRDPVPERFPEQSARRLIDRASLNIAWARDASQELRDLRRLPLDGELAIRADLAEGLQALNEHRNERGQELFHQALARAESAGDLYYQAAALSNLSFSAKRLGRYEESVEYGERAVAAAAKAGARRVEGLGHLNLGPSYNFLGEFDAALKHERLAVLMMREMGMHVNEMTARGELGLIEDMGGDPPAAIPDYRRAYEMAMELDRKGDATRFTESLALTYIQTKQWKEAADWNRRAEELAAVTGESTAYLERNRALIARATGRADEAARIAKRLLADAKLPRELVWAAHDLLGHVYADAGRREQAGREFEIALRSIDGAQSALAESHYKITLLSYLMPFYQDYVEVLAERKDDAGALRVVESSRARVLAERMGRPVQPAAMPGPAELRQFAGALNRSLLTFWLAPDRSYAWLIRAEGVRRFDLPPAREIESLVTAYRKVVEHSVQDPLASADPALWNRVMAPIAAAIPRGSRVIVIPDGPLHRLNLETLVVPGPQPHYWIEDVELEVAPSMTIAMAKAPAPHCDRRLLLIGDPDYRGTGYEPLPGAAREVREIEARFPGPQTAAYTGAKASPAAYRGAQPERFSTIHFAAHADANVEKPLESAVVLARNGDSYKLYARDVVDIPIHADLVTLSACRSAGAREYAGEGLIGFAWAFLQAGARSVVAGLWDVSDVSSEALMARFYAGIAGKKDPSTALREAKLELVRGDPRFRKAFYWGAFQVYVAGLGR